MAEAGIQAVLAAVMAEILCDRRLSFPAYRPEIGSEAEAQAAAAELPLVYSWNEVVREGRLQSLTVSVNGSRIAQMLERHLPWAHPALAAARDALTTMLCETQNRMLLSPCAEFQATPGQLTARLAP